MAFEGNMEILIVVIILVFLLAVWMLFSNRSYFRALLPGPRKSAEVDTGSKNSEITAWHSVKIRPGFASCVSVKNMTNQIYLASEAPALPIGQCTEKECQCRYIRLDDRRDSENRRAILEHPGHIYLRYQRDDRRQITERRTTDSLA
jgi:hypothetical protein